MVFLLLMLVSTSPAAKIGKLEQVRLQAREHCPRIKMADREILELTRRLYLTCVPGTEVVLAEQCRMKCLKTLRGAVVGGEGR